MNINSMMAARWRDHDRRMVRALPCMVSAFAIVCWPGCAKYDSKPSNASRPGITAVANTDNDDRRGDVVFVHGLGGDGKSTWSCPSGVFYWPAELGKQFPDIGVWTVSYDAEASNWLGSTMPVADRSKNLLERLRLEGIGKRSVVFVSHSLGGIVVKQMLRDAMTVGEEDWAEIGENTRGVVFLATPNNGSDLAKLGDVLRKLGPVFRLTVTQSELRPNESLLRELNFWYRNVAADQVETAVFYETGSPQVPVIVDEGSSDPGINNVTPIRLDGDHLSICKPCSTQDLVVKHVADFVDSKAIPEPVDWEIGFAEFFKEFEALESDPAQRAKFVEAHIGRRVTWSGVVRRVSPHTDSPTYDVAPTVDAGEWQFAVAPFSVKRFNAKLVPGDRVTIRGIVKDARINGVILDKCQLVSVPEAKR